MDMFPSLPWRASLKDALDALPALDPPAGGWVRLTQVLDARRARGRRWRLPLALAASILAAIVVTARLIPRTPEPVASAASYAALERDVAGDVAGLMAQSRALELTLAQLRHEAPVWDARADARADALERSLTLVDLQLAYAGPADTQDLWRERVALMSNLVRTHRQASLLPAADELNGENRI